MKDRKYSENCYLYCPYYLYHNLIKGYKDLYRQPNSVYVERKDIDFTNEYITEHLNIPILKGISDKSIEKEINDEIESDILEFKRQMEEAAKEAHLKAEAEGEAFSPYVISTIYELTYNKNNLISVSIIYDEYINRKHYYIQTSYNYNIKTGISLSIGDLFKKDANYVQLINSYIREYIRSHPEEFLPETINRFQGIAIDQPFFLEDNSIMIYFGFHQIAPSTAQIPIIQVPFAAFPNHIKPKLLD